MEVIAEIRRRHLVSGESISAIARDLKLSRPTVRKHLQTESEAVYLRQNQPAPKLGDFSPIFLTRTHSSLHETSRCHQQVTEFTVVN